METILAALAKTGSTGNITGAGVGTQDGAVRVGIQFVVEAVGATPTVTWKVQGSFDGTDWYDVFYVSDSSDTATAATRSATGVGAQAEWLDLDTRFYVQYRVVTTLNTNVTFRTELYFQVAR